jgi:hypothetical protein
MAALVEDREPLNERDREYDLAREPEPDFGAHRQRQRQHRRYDGNESDG